jgi:hypothetical protein
MDELVVRQTITFATGRVTLMTAVGRHTLIRSWRGMRVGPTKTMKGYEEIYGSEVDDGTLLI